MSHAFNIRSCAECGTTRTSQWRYGITNEGQKSLLLCNACGIRHRRREGGTSITKRRRITAKRAHQRHLPIVLPPLPTLLHYPSSQSTYSSASAPPSPRSIPPVPVVLPPLLQPTVAQSPISISSLLNS